MRLHYLSLQWSCRFKFIVKLQQRRQGQICSLIWELDLYLEPNMVDKKTQAVCVTQDCIRLFDAYVIYYFHINFYRSIKENITSTYKHCLDQETNMQLSALSCLTSQVEQPNSDLDHFLHSLQLVAKMLLLFLWSYNFFCI